MPIAVHRGGFFVDVGAGDPTFGSVTKNLVDRLGWHGINIEPLSECRARLEAERPRDVNLAVAIDEQAGTARFFRIVAANGLVGGPALSTLDADVVARHGAAGWGSRSSTWRPCRFPRARLGARRPAEGGHGGRRGGVLRSAELERWLRDRLSAPALPATRVGVAFRSATPSRTAEHVVQNFDDSSPRLGPRDARELPTRVR